MNILSKVSQGLLMVISMFGQVFADDNAFTWTGLYAGLNAGFNFNTVQLKSQHLAFTNPSDHCNSNVDFSTFFPGIQLGYLYQLPNAIVFGIEGNVAFNVTQNKTLGCNSAFDPNVYDRFSVRNQMQSAVNARLGRALSWHNNSILPYLMAGTSFANIGLSYTNEINDYYELNSTKSALLLGAGIEWSFRKNWSLRFEYNYIHYENATQLQLPDVYDLIDPNGNARFNLLTNTVSLAIHYWI